MTSAIDRAVTAPDLLAALVADDATAPRLTWYDDSDGQTRGERIELSARVLANWVAKAANLLVDELDVEHGDAVRLDLPPHWRTLYWALACWRTGAVVQLGVVDGELAPRVVVAHSLEAARDLRSRVVAVSLPALARRWTGEPRELPATVVDEAAELGPQPDVFEPPEELDPDAVALGSQTQHWSGAELVDQARSLAAERGWRHGERIAVVAQHQGQALAAILDVLAAWSVGGSVVLVFSPAPVDLARRWAAERVTSVCTPPGSPI